MNVFGETKESICQKLYEALDHGCEISVFCDKEEFILCAVEALGDYVLIPKTCIVED